MEENVPPVESTGNTAEEKALDATEATKTTETPEASEVSIESAQTSTPVDTNPDLTQNMSPKKPKKGLPKWVYGLIGAVGVFIIGAGIYLKISSNPTQVLKKSINDAYTEISKSLKEFKDMDFNILEDSFKISGDASVSGSTLKDFSKDKISFALGMDYKNKKMELNGKLLEDNKTLVDGNLFIKNNAGYVSSDTLLDGVYKLGDFDWDEEFDLSEIEEVLNSEQMPSIDEIDKLAKNFTKALSESLNEEYMTKEKEEIDINDITVNANKITYEINDKSVSDLLDTLLDKLKKDDDFLEIVAKIADQDKKDIKDLLDESQDALEIEDFGELEFSVYTAGITNKIIGFSLNTNDNEEVNIEFYNYKDNIYAVIEAEGTKIELTSVKEKKEYDVRLNVYYEEAKIELARLTVRQFDDEGIDLDYHIGMTDVFTADGTLKLTGKKVNDKEYSGEFAFSIKTNIDDQDLDVGIKLNYKLEIGANIADVKTNNAKDIEDLDENTVMDKLDELKSSQIYEALENFDLDLGNLAQEEKIDPYDDDACFSNYLSDYDYSGTYLEYYDLYCA